MKQLVIHGKNVIDIINMLNGKSYNNIDDVLNKALSHKYIRRWPAKSGKGWEYLYPKHFLHPFKALISLFGFKKEKIEDDYTKNNIQKDYGVDKVRFAGHVLEYFSNKPQWDSFFAKKENQEKYKTPQSKAVGTGKKKDGASGSGTGGAVKPVAGAKKRVDGSKKKKKTEGLAVNTFLMRKIWGIYNGKEEKNGADNAESGQSALSDVVKPVQSRNVESQGGGTGSGPVFGAPDNRGDALQRPIESGERSGRDVRLNKKQARDIRRACIELLNSKSDSEMTETDKALLRRYEGAGGLGGEDADVHGTLYEFYTPRTVAKKVWEIVDKYIPGVKSVLEPSAGVGRFAEERPNDTFTLNEYDETASRISGILHPGAVIRQGAFQEMFNTGKQYTGKKYDVVIGNPPYGAYSGIWKGRGEGKGHTRYEEYFIDRGLDTLREGGIMAFVVPSSFLRNGRSKIKEKIAGKGKLMEAWRLPNGTFNTTGVGTDIIIVRKEKGDPAQFSNNAYFEQNPRMVAGDETTRNGRFGDEKYVGLKDGETFDEAVGNINAGAVEAVPIDGRTEKEAVIERVEVKESEAEKHKNRSGALLGNQNAKKDGGPEDKPPAPTPGQVDTLEEFNRKYNKRFDPRDLKIMLRTGWNGAIDVSRLTSEELKYLKTSGNYVETGDNGWVSAANFASGNIYQKLDELEELKEDMPAWEYRRQKNLLESVLPTKKTVFDFSISPISDFSDEYTIETPDGDRNLNGAFKRWLWELDSSNIPNEISKNDIIDYVNRKPVRSDSRTEDKTAAQIERARTVSVRREVAENLFNQFIREQLSVQEQERIADKLNRLSNGTVQADHTKIPAFVDGISKTFKGRPLVVGDIQLKGVGSLVNRGNGILAYDVGVGKTLAGILATVSQIQTGRASRPLICVPKAVYKNWISEIKQLFPGIKVNELNNFRDIKEYKNADGSLNIPEGSLSICTYEALQSVSFTEKTLDDELVSDFFDSQSNTDIEHDSKRKRAEEAEKIRAKLGKASKSTERSILWEETGFDHITVDEMHNFKNVFGEARAKNKGQSNEFKGLTGGRPSDRALKLFAITQLIQRKNNGRNVFGLTATPFTNSPIEIYNILSLVARDELKKSGIFNLHEFMARFALLKTELAQTAKGDIESKTVMKEFKNLFALQNLINMYIDKVDGEEAGIIRPNKTQHLVDINMSEEQKTVYEEIIRYMNTANTEEDPGAVLRGLNALRSLTVSPVLLRGTRFATSLSPKADFVKSSPKMTFVCGSAAALYKEQPRNGQVIYLPEGINYFEDVRKYLVKKGIPQEAVAFLSPEHLPAGDKGNDRKEEIMRDFNDPNGKIKVIIGSGSIKEGVNLNGNTTTLYNCMLGWNPTETVQVEGRIHRQGNSQGEVHIVYPLMNDTVDSFMYQKHYEKSKRINAVFSYKGDTLNVEDINPEELRFNLIKDPQKRADLQIKQEVEAINSRVITAQSTADKIINIYREREELIGTMNEYTDKINAVKRAAETFSKLSDEQIIDRYGNKEDDGEAFDMYLDEFSDIKGGSWIAAKDAEEFRKKYERIAADGITFLRRRIAGSKGKSETLFEALKRYNVDPDSEESALKNSQKYGAEAAELKADIAKIQKSREAYIHQAQKQLEEYAKEHPGKNVNQAISDTAAAIKSNIRPMDEVSKEIKMKRQSGARSSLSKSIGGKKMLVFLRSSATHRGRGA